MINTFKKLIEYANSNGCGAEKNGNVIVVFAGHTRGNMFDCGMAYKARNISEGVMAVDKISADMKHLAERQKKNDTYIAVAKQGVEDYICNCGLICNSDASAHYDDRSYVVVVLYCAKYYNDCPDSEYYSETSKDELHSKWEVRLDPHTGFSSILTATKHNRSKCG